MQAIDRLAESAGVPVTWMIGNPEYVSANADYYNRLHAAYGDDVEIEDGIGVQATQAALPWYAPMVSVQGAGHERKIAELSGLGDSSFWGITWNSHGTDNTSDEGAPWGSYCADRASYKRPSPSGDCSLVSLEWTARDLTRSFLTDTNSNGYSAEAAFSSDPDDVLRRAGFDARGGAAYARELVDAYAAAGQTQPLVMMSQQESGDEADAASGNDIVLEALYREAVRDGMRTVTMRRAATLAATFSAAPRAIAFPFLAGGITTQYDGLPFAPATIDFHDDAAGMTFVSGRTLPVRLFDYTRDPVSVFNKTLAMTIPSDPSFPTLTSVTAANGTMRFAFRSPEPIHFGVALWTDPASLGFVGPNVTPAGRAGVVITFDLPAGTSTQVVPCSGCSSTTLSYSE